MIIEDFFLRALLAGVGVSLATGPIGCFMVWRRLAYFGETIAHSALLGVTLGYIFEVDRVVGIVVVTILISLLLIALQKNRLLANDTLLAILSHAALSSGLVIISLIVGLRLDLMGFLFGDILAVSTQDLVWIYGSTAVSLLILAFIWRPLLAITVHEDLAVAEGVPAAGTRLIFMVLLALTIALSMKIVGILLITSLLIIPAATARSFVRSPEQMAVAAAGLGAVAVGIGLTASLYLDTPSGPSVVVAATGLFLISHIRYTRTATSR